MLIRRTFGFVFVALTLGAVAFSQEFRATVTGRVTDPTGTGIPAAKVTVQNVGTNEQSVATTTGDGDYTVPFLIPGKYNLTAEAPGFKHAARNDIELRVNDKVTVNFAMEIGAVTESVEVSAAPPLLETATASRGAVVDNLRVTELPLSGRNPINFVNLTPGVVFAGNPQFTRPFDNGDNINFSINGGLRQTNEYLIDGSPDDAVTDTTTDRTHAVLNIAYIPTVDAVQEFRVMTNFYDAQYGRTGGGVVNITTKSGTNAFHGTAYEFLRRYQLDANDIGSNAAGRPRYAVDPATGKNLGGHKLDQYGTQITGPVWIPGVYKGKDKTFFSFGVENYVETSPSPIITSVPSLAERNGDFSKAGVNIYDPFKPLPNPAYDTTKGESASNPQYIRAQFTNNMITSDRFNAAGLGILRAYPAPNFGPPDAVVNNYLASPNLGEDHFRNWIARVDQAFGQKERMFFRYGHNRRNQFQSGNGFPGPGMDAQDPLVRLNDNAVVDSVTVLTPATILNLRVGYTRFIQAAYRTQVTGYDITQLGFPASFAAQRFNSQPPAIEFDDPNIHARWGARNPSQNTTNVLSFMPSMSFLRGRHSMKAGVEIRDIRPNARGGSFLWGAGEFMFTTDFTRRLPAFADGSGDRFAALLLGVPTSGILQYVPILAFRWGYYGFYFQDDFRVSNRLTVNMGLRYDIEGSPTERYNRMNRGFAFNTPNPLGSVASVKNANAADCPACANLTGGLLFVNSGGQPRTAFNSDLNNWQPRIGAAYRVSDRTVLRGGYGIFYLPEGTYGGSAGFSSNTPFLTNITGGNQFIPTGTLSNPFPNGPIAPSGASGGLATFAGNDVIFQNPNRKIPYVHSFSFGVQHQLPWNLVLDTSYVGSRTIGVNTNDNQAGGARNINVLSTSQLAQAHLNPAFYNAAVPNPFAGLLPGTSLNGATVARRQLLVPYPEFGQVLFGLEPVGKIWYDSLQVNLEKRFSTGLVFEGAYTWSKNLEAVAFLNNQDPAPTRNLAGTDRTHRFVFSGVYQLPFGHSKHFASGAGRALNFVIGGWELNWIGTMQSGTPRDLPGNYDLIGDLHVPDQTGSQWFNTCELLPNGTTRQPNAAHTGFVTGCSNPAWLQRSDPTFTLRTTPFRTNLRSPWAPQWDMSLNKRFIITESVNAEFRFESFNTFNTVIRNEPNNDPNSPNFGQVQLGQRNFPRQVQLGFKFNF